MTEITKLPDVTTGNTGNWTQPESEDASIERMATKLAPLRSLKGGWDETDRPKVALRDKAPAAITFSAVQEGLNKLISRMNEVRSMGEVLRSRLTRDAPTGEVAGPSPIESGDEPVFEHLARLTIALSHEIEMTEKHLALSLSALK